MIDMAPTLLEFFRVEPPADMQGVSLEATIAQDTPVREAGLFGYHGCHVNVTDGRYVYMRGPQNPDNSPLYEYTLMPTHIKSLFSVEELQDIELAPPFSFSKGCRLMKVDGLGWSGSLNPYLWGSLLFDLESDPGQKDPLVDPEIEARMLRLMVQLMRQNDAPKEQYERLGLPYFEDIGREHLVLSAQDTSADQVGMTEVTWIGKGKKMYYTLLTIFPVWLRRQFSTAMSKLIQQSGVIMLDEDQVLELACQAAPPGEVDHLRLMAQIVKEKG